MRKCTKCNGEFNINMFHKKSTSLDGLSHTCKACKRKQDAEYRAKHKEELNKKRKEKYYKDPEKYRTLTKNYYNNLSKEDREKMKAKKASYNKTASEEVKQRKRDYDKKYFSSVAGKLVTLKSAHKRRAQQIGTDDNTITSQALTELKIKQSNKCAYCDVVLDFSAKGTVHLDHVIPLSKGGAHSITNVVWSCASCNLTKNNKIITPLH